VPTTESLARLKTPAEKTACASFRLIFTSISVALDDFIDKLLSELLSSIFTHFRRLVLSLTFLLFYRRIKAPSRSFPSSGADVVTSSKDDAAGSMKFWVIFRRFCRNSLTLKGKVLCWLDDKSIPASIRCSFV